MRVFETSVQELKNDVLRSVAKLAWEDDLQTGILDIGDDHAACACIFTDGNSDDTDGACSCNKNILAHKIKH